MDLPSGDHATSICNSFRGPVSRFLSSPLAREWTMRRYSPALGLLANRYANLWPSGEKLMLESISVISFCGCPPSTGARYRYFRELLPASMRVK